MILGIEDILILDAIYGFLPLWYAACAWCFDIFDIFSFSTILFPFTGRHHFYHYIWKFRKIFISFFHIAIIRYFVFIISFDVLMNNNNIFTKPHHLFLLATEFDDIMPLMTDDFCSIGLQAATRALGFSRDFFDFTQPFSFHHHSQSVISRIIVISHIWWVISLKYFHLLE